MMRGGYCREEWKDNRKSGGRIPIWTISEVPVALGVYNFVGSGAVKYSQ